MAAKDRGLGGFAAGIGAIVGDAIVNGMGGERAPSQKSGRPQKSKQSGESSKSEKQESPETREARRQANANTALREEAITQILFNQITENNRNVDAAIEDFVKVLEYKHKELRNNNGANVRVSSGADINQVTAGEIRSSVERAYDDAHLTHFDRLAGELWTRDRLLVQILWEAKKGILPYFNGVGAKGPDVTNLQEVFKEAAKSVYARALELSDVIGVSYSFDRFIRTIYENSDRAPQGLWTVGADVYYERMLTRVINGVDTEYFTPADQGPAKSGTRGERLSQQFEFRFRARRTLYDCLAASYLELTTMGATNTSLQLTGVSGGDRGVRVDSLDRMPNVGSMAEARTDNAPAVKTGETAMEVWQRAQHFAGEKCRAPLIGLAQTAHNTSLTPISARWDSAAGTQKSQDQYLQIRIDDPR